MCSKVRHGLAREGRQIRWSFPLFLAFFLKQYEEKKPQDDKVIGSLEFKIIKALINSTPIDEMAGRSEIPAIFFSFGVDCVAFMKQQRGLAYSSCFSVRKLFSQGASGEQN